MDPFGKSLRIGINRHGPERFDVLCHGICVPSSRLHPAPFHRSMRGVVAGHGFASMECWGTQSCPGPLRVGNVADLLHTSCAGHLYVWFVRFSVSMCWFCSFASMGSWCATTPVWGGGCGFSTPGWVDRRSRGCSGHGMGKGPRGEEKREEVGDRPQPHHPRRHDQVSSLRNARESKQR